LHVHANNEGLDGRDPQRRQMGVSHTPHCRQTEGHNTHDYVKEGLCTLRSHRLIKAILDPGMKYHLRHALPF